MIRKFSLCVMALLSSSFAYLPYAAMSAPADTKVQSASPTQPAAEKVDVKLVDQGWRVICQTVDTSRSALSCRAIFEAFGPNGQRAIAVEIFREGARRTLVVTAPLGTLLSKSLEIRVDQTSLPATAFEQCQQAGCLARLQLTDALFTTLRKAKDMTVSFDLGGNAVVLPVALLGLGLALSKAEI